MSKSQESKSQECYAALFKYIEEHVFEMQPDEIITDFEDGLRAAIRKEWTDVILRGCWYHYCVCICKQFLKLSMGQLLKTNANARRLKNMILCLPLLPAELFDQGLEYIKTQAVKTRLSKRFSSFFTYFNYWVNQVKYFLFRTQRTKLYNYCLFIKLEKLHVFLKKKRNLRNLCIFHTNYK